MLLRATERYYQHKKISLQNLIDTNEYKVEVYDHRHNTALTDHIFQKLLQCATPRDAQN